MTNIITPQQAKAEAQKPWLNDLRRLALESKTMIDNGLQNVLAICRLEQQLMNVDILIRFGEFDEAFVMSAFATQNPMASLEYIRLIIDVWDKLKGELSEDFVDKNGELCKNVTIMLENVKNENGIKQKKCNLIIQRLSEKKEATDVEK